jgi:hypothetical protein
VYWKLGPDERELAARGRVRLRRLVDYCLPAAEQRPAAKPKAEPRAEPAVQVRSVVLDPLAIELKLSGPTELSLGKAGRVKLGSAEQPAMGKLSVAGALRYRAQRRSKAKPTRISVHLRRLRAALESMRVGGFQLDAGAIVVGSIDAPAICFEGLQPRQLDLSAQKIELGQVTAARQS